MIFGASFTPDYAQYLGFDYKELYKTILNDWQFKYVRLPAVWDRMEKERGKLDFSELDWLMDEAAKSGAKVTLVVGQKTPRWPECHLPDWALNLSHEEYRQKLLGFIGAVAAKYKNHPALEIWQVENEPFLPFGKCVPMSQKEYKEELGLVKNIDSAHPTMATDSGELSTWFRTARLADYFGMTMYRVVWNKFIGYLSYEKIFPAFFYRFKLWVNGVDVNKAFVSELQAEPWIPDRTLSSTPLPEQYKSMDLNRLRRSAAFAEKTGMSRAYLWGAEWWYWLEKQGNGEFVNYIKQLKKE